MQRCRSTFTGGIEEDDQAIKLIDIIDETRPLSLALPSNLSYLQNDNGYLYSNNPGTSGFVAMVNFINDKYVITFRGTDSSLTAYGSTLQVVLAGTPPTAPASQLYQGILDYGDANTSAHLGRGSVAATQWDAAKDLVDFVLYSLAGGDKSKVVVTGQSMGGGLAALASAYFGVEGNVFAPAPYGNQLTVEAMRLAMPAFMAGGRPSI
jgi:hypothetical protein